MRRPIIPKFEIEVLTAMARTAHVTVDEMPDTSLARIERHGVTLMSRGRNAAEYHLLVEGVDAIPGSLLKHIDGIYCDSHEGDHYEIDFDGFLSHAEMKTCVVAFARAVTRVRHGHNGIDALVEGVIQIALSAAWDD